MIKTYKTQIIATLTLLTLGQVLFSFAAPKYTTQQYENKIYATVGIEFADDNLHKLNEAAHYFGQTMIGWVKFPNFTPRLKTILELPEEITMNAHMQERQNLIFTLYTISPLDESTLKDVATYIQGEMDKYNQEAGTRFKLTNQDYEIINTTRSYANGAMITLLLTLVVAFGLIFIHYEFTR